MTHKHLVSSSVLALSAALIVGAVLFSSHDGFPDGDSTLRSTPKLSRKAARKQARSDWRLKSLVDENGAIPQDAVMVARAQLDAMNVAAPLGSAAGLDSTKWTEHGPGNMGGRTRSLVIHPTKPDTMWTGAVSGGVWMTTDGGRSWSKTDDALTSLAVTSIVLDPTNPNTLYAGTGEQEGSWGSIRGAGIFKSTNGGLQWTRLASTAGAAFHFVNRLAIAPDGSALLAATSSNEIYRSTDGGATWTSVFQGNATTAPVWDVVFHPTKSNLAVAATNDIDANNNDEAYCLFTTDGGLTWQRATGIGSSGSTSNRIVLTYHAGYSLGNGMVYAIENRADLAPVATQIWRSSDGGASYTLLSTNRILGDQGSYDSTIWVNPSDTDNMPSNDVVIAGGIVFWRSTDGGVTFTAISRDSAASRASAHNDEHCVVAHPGFNGVSNKTVFVGTDGAIYRTDDIFTVSLTGGWIDLRNSLAITQFYGGARGPSGILYGGTQDNGTLSLQPGRGINDWEESAPGDGTFVAADFENPAYLYGAYPNASVHRSSDGGRSTVDISTGLLDAGSGQTAAFVSPLLIDPNSAKRLYVGAVRLWKTDDARQATPTWTVVKPAINGSPMISAIAVAPGDANLVFVGYDNGAIEYSTNALAATPTWTTRNAGLPARFCTRVMIDPSDHRRVFACFGGFNSDNIWESKDSGQTWAVRATTPLAAPVRDLLVNPFDASWLYAATEVGMIASVDGGATWTGTATPTRAPIDQMFWADTKVWLVSHGRGFFSQMPCGSTGVVGSGCNFTSPATGPSLVADQARIGRTTTFSVTGATQASTAGVLLLGIPAPTPLPFGNFCRLYIDILNGPLINLGAFGINGGTGTFPLAIPNDVNLDCAEPRFQAVVVSTNSDPFLTNGVVMRVGR
mgnify:CR=1 FL=1